MTRSTTLLKIFILMAMMVSLRTARADCDTSKCPGTKAGDPCYRPRYCDGNPKMPPMPSEECDNADRRCMDCCRSHQKPARYQARQR